jgi:hypothetical protein
MRMKATLLFCLLCLGCGLPPAILAQPKRFINHSDYFPDRAGRLVAFKVHYEGAPDTVYFLDVPSATITDRVAEGSFGLEFKLMKAKVLKSDRSMGQGARAQELYGGEGRMEKYTLYQVRRNDSLIASAWLPKTGYAFEEPRAVFRSSPRRVLMYRRQDGRRSLYNMLDTSANGVAKLLYLDKANKEAEHEQSFIWAAHISPDGRYVLAATECVMIDIEKGKVMWDYPWERSEWFLATFSEDCSRVAIQRNAYAVSIRDVQSGKELNRIPAPPAKLGNLDVSDCLPLADMQHALIYYWNAKTYEAKLFLFGVDGSRKEIAF